MSKAPPAVSVPRFSPAPSRAQMKAPTHEPPANSEPKAADLNAPERVLLFCLASNTDWFKAGVTPTTAKKMLVKGLIERDGAGRLILTEQDRAALASLMQVD
jgi:hypothetical protein